LTAPLKTIWLKSTSTSPKRLAYEDTFAEVLVVHVSVLHHTLCTFCR